MYERSVPLNADGTGSERFRLFGWVSSDSNNRWTDLLDWEILTSSWEGGGGEVAYQTLVHTVIA